MSNRIKFFKGRMLMYNAMDEEVKVSSKKFCNELDLLESKFKEYVFQELSFNYNLGGRKLLSDDINTSITYVYMPLINEAKHVKSNVTFRKLNSKTFVKQWYYYMYTAEIKVYYVDSDKNKNYRSEDYYFTFNMYKEIPDGYIITSYEDVLLLMKQKFQKKVFSNLIK